MSTPDFTKPGRESFWVDNRQFDCVVFADKHGKAYQAWVEHDGRVVYMSYTLWSDISDAWAWVVGALSNHVRGLQ